LQDVAEIEGDGEGDVDVLDEEQRTDGAGQPGQAGDGAQHAQAQVKQSDSIGYPAQ